MTSELLPRPQPRARPGTSFGPSGLLCTRSRIKSVTSAFAAAPKNQTAALHPDPTVPDQPVTKGRWEETMVGGTWAELSWETLEIKSQHHPSLK